MFLIFYACLASFVFKHSLRRHPKLVTLSFYAGLPVPGTYPGLALPVTVPYSLEIAIASRMGLGHKQVHRECFWGEKKQLPQLGWWKPAYIWQQHRGGISQAQSLNAVVWSPRSNPWVTKANTFLFFQVKEGSCYLWPKESCIRLKRNANFLMLSRSLLYKLRILQRA